MDAPLTLQEFIMAERVPLADVFRAVFEFLAGRRDAVVFGAQAVNVYVGEPRMTHDVDVLSTHAGELAEDLRRYLSENLRMATRVRAIPSTGEARGFRIYQVRKGSAPRHLVDVRQVRELPRTRRRAGVAVIAPEELVAMKVRSLAARGRQEKGLTDRLDLLRLLRAFPDLRTSRRVVILDLLFDDTRALTTWYELLGETFEEPGEW